MNNGTILLERQEANFFAGFSIIRESLVHLAKNISFLHPDEKKYYHSLQFDRRKESYLLGRMAAKKAIGEFVGEAVAESVCIDFGVFHFPVVKSAAHPNVQVSISHCGNLAVALAFPEAHPMGIDIEKIDQDKLNAMKSCLGSGELDLLADCDLAFPAGCTMLWSAREGLSKILRTGLTASFTLLEIASIDKEGPLFISTFRHFSQYKAVSGQVDGHICSIVLPKNTAAVMDRFWSALVETATA